MHSIQNFRICTPTPFKKATAGITYLLVITVIALSIIGFAASLSGPFNVMVDLGSTPYGFFLGAFISVLIPDLVWIVALREKTTKQSLNNPSGELSSLDSKEFVKQTLRFSGEVNDQGLFTSQTSTRDARKLPESEEVKPKTQVNHESLLAKKHPLTIDDSQAEVTLAPDVPLEVNLMILSYLNEDDLEKCCYVSKSWRKVASNPYLWNAFDLKTIFPSLKVFDESDWVTHFDLSSFELDVVISPLNKRLAIPFLKRCLSSLPIEGDAGVTLLTIPKGLTLNKLIKLAGSLKVKNRPKFRYIRDDILNEMGEILVDKTYRIVITNHVFKNSRTLYPIDPKAIVSQISCEVPRVLEAVVLLVVTFMNSGERIYSDNPWTYTYCLEHLKHLLGSPVAVGGFSPDGIRVDHYVGKGRMSYCGVGGVLRISD